MIDLRFFDRFIAMLYWVGVRVLIIECGIPDESLPGVVMILFSSLGVPVIQNNYHKIDVAKIG